MLSRTTCFLQIENITKDHGLQVAYNVIDAIVATAGALGDCSVQQTLQGEHVTENEMLHAYALLSTILKLMYVTGRYQHPVQSQVRLGYSRSTRSCATSYRQVA